MSGIFGILDSRNTTAIEKTLNRMCSQLSHCEWYVSNTYIDGDYHVGLGRVGIGKLNQEKQPVCSEDGNLVVFLTGELYDTLRIRRDLKKKGYRLRDNSDLELILRLYQEKKEKFVHDLEGIFIVGIWNRIEKKLVLANDRFGLCPTYYAHFEGKLIFANQMQGILCDPCFNKQLDMTALAEHMRFQQLLGRKTFFKGLKLFPNASIMVYYLDTDKLNISSYWDFTQVPTLTENVRYDEILEEMGRLLKQVVNRLASGPLRPGIYLSGGLDSRLVLGLVDRINFPFVSITYGHRDSRDVFYGNQVAKQVGSNHYWFEFKDGNWIKEYAVFHLDLVEGFNNWLHSHGISTLPHARDVMDVNLTGWAVDYVVGGHWGKFELMNSVDDLDFLRHFFHFYNQKYSWPGISDGEEQFLYLPDFYPRVQGLAFESFKRELEPFNNFDFPRRAEFFDQINHNLRMTGTIMTFMRSHFDIRYVAYDYELYNFATSIPMHLRIDRRMQKDLISLMAPALAKIPRDKDEMLLTRNPVRRNVHALAYRLKNRINRHIYPLFDRRVTLYADFENYLRSELRPWAENILFDKTTLDRGIFNPDFIHSIWARHLSGREMHTVGKIAPIMNYEMMLRRFFD